MKVACRPQTALFRQANKHQRGHWTHNLLTAEFPCVSWQDVAKNQRHTGPGQPRPQHTNTGAERQMDRYVVVLVLLIHKFEMMFDT